MELAWTPELADVAEALAVQGRATRSALKMVGLLTCCLLLVVVGLGTSTDTLVSGGFGGLVVVGLLWIARPVFVRRLWRRTPGLREPVIATVSTDHGIELRTESGSTIRRWSGIDGFYETDRVFVIRLSGYRLSLLTLAKRGVSSPDQLDDLRMILTARTPSPAS